MGLLSFPVAVRCLADRRTRLRDEALTGDLLGS
jgi:hypothetical protein